MKLPSLVARTEVSLQHEACIMIGKLSHHCSGPWVELICVPAHADIFEARQHFQLKYRPHIGPNAMHL